MKAYFFHLTDAMLRRFKTGDYVRVTKSDHYTEFVRFRNRYFYSLLRSKFVVWNQDHELRGGK